MIRASKNGILFDDFARGYVAIGWSVLGDLRQYPEKAALKQAYIEHYGDEKPSKTANAVSLVHRFAHTIASGDLMLTYNPRSRTYLVGEDLGEYRHQAGVIERYTNIRNVHWYAQVRRDHLSAPVRSSLTSTLSLFELKGIVIEEIEQYQQPLGKAANEIQLSLDF